MTNASRPTSLGLTGSLGSGKSFVGELLAEAGHAVLDADLVAREAVAPGTPGLRAVVETFGNRVLAPDGTLLRPLLASIVFADPEARQRLEAIIHPMVRERELAFLEQHRGPGLPILSIPLLFETGAESLVSHTVVVTVDERTRRHRLAERPDRLSQQEIERRLAAQMPQDEKIRRADFVIDNSGSRDETRRQVRLLCQHIEGMAADTPPPSS